MQPPSVFLHYLSQLTNLLNKIEAADEHAPELLDARIHESMLPLTTQVKIVCNFSLRACCQLADTEVVSFDAQTDGYAPLYRQIEQTVAHIKQLDFNRPKPQTGTDKAGFAEVNLPIDEYVSGFALPNFFFHLSMVYAIARANGIDVSKGDFDGYHQYPPGFSWEKQ